MYLVQETNQLFSSVIISKGDPYCSVAIEYQPLDYLVNLDNSLLDNASVNVLYDKLLFHLSGGLVED